VKLNVLLKSFDHKCLLGDEYIEITDLTNDSRKVNNGCAFIAIKGDRYDGHEFLDRVVKSGAKALIVDETYFTIDRMNQIMDLDVTLVSVPSTKAILSSLSHIYFEKPSEKMTVVGVTGTNGKTSITHMLNQMYKCVTPNTAVFGTIENKIINCVYPAINTTADALTLNHLFKIAVENKVSHCFMEVSSHALSLGRVSSIDFDYAVFTNLTEDHLDFHSDFEDYFEAKKRLFKMAKKGLVINRDDQYGLRLWESFHNEKKCISYGLSKACDVTLKNIAYGPNGSTGFLVTPFGQSEVEFNTLGKIYVYNTLACIAMMLLDGYSFDTCMEAIKQITPVRGRLEKVMDIGNHHVMVDYAHTPDALFNVLEVIKPLKLGKIITVFGCGGDRDRKKRPLMGKIAETYSDITVITSDNPRTENPDLIIDDIFKGIDSTQSIYREVDRERAIYLALDLATENDFVLIAGKGHENYQVIGQEKKHFDDKEIVQKYFNTINASPKGY